VNDCFWFMVGACGDRCGQCGMYLSLNSGEGREIIAKYEDEIEEAIKPVKERWKIEFERTEKP